MKYIHMRPGEHWCDEKDSDGNGNDNESRQIHDSRTFVHYMQQIGKEEKCQRSIFLAATNKYHFTIVKWIYVTYMLN